LNYQWQFNGTNIGAATSSSLALSNVQPADAGAFTVAVSNAHGSATSSNATLTVDTAVNLNFAGFTSSGFELRVTGPVGIYVLQASTNLVDWTDICTNKAPNGILEFSDSNRANFERRFYRARSQ